jgi:hypothetical protein
MVHRAAAIKKKEEEGTPYNTKLINGILKNITDIVCSVTDSLKKRVLPEEALLCG